MAPMKSSAVLYLFFRIVILRALTWMPDRTTPSKWWTVTSKREIKKSRRFVWSTPLSTSSLAKSIEELAIMFKDLGTLVIEQGSMVDRIDYNMEQTVTRMKEGVQELVKVYDCSLETRSVGWWVPEIKQTYEDDVHFGSYYCHSSCALHLEDCGEKQRIKRFHCLWRCLVGEQNTKKQR